MRNKEMKMNSTMDSNKGKKTVLIVVTTIIVVLLIITGIFAGLYFTTDLFKSNKQLFMKNMGLAFEQIRGDVDNKLKNYTEKKKNTPYTNEGTYTSNIEVNEKAYEDINNFNISFKGKVDNVNSKAEQEISLNYDEENKFPFKYKKVGDKIGLQCDQLTELYTTADEDKLNLVFGDEFQEYYNELISNPETVEKATEENTYTNDLEKIDESKFIKTDNTYELTLEGEDAKNFLSNVEQSVLEDKENEAVKNIVNDISKITIKVTKLNNNYEISIDMGVISLEIKRANASEETTYDITATVDIQELMKNNLQSEEESEENMEPIKVNFQASYNGVETNNATEKYTFNIQVGEFNSNHVLTNNVTFGGETDIEDFTEENSQDLTAQDEKVIEGFTEQVVQKVGEINEELAKNAKMEHSISYEIPVYDVIMYTMEQMFKSVLSTTDNAKSEISSVEAADRINSTLSIVFASSLTAEGEITDSEEDIISGNNLDQNYNVKINNNAQEGEDLLTVTYKTSEGEEIEGKILKGEIVNKIVPAEVE